MKYYKNLQILFLILIISGHFSLNANPIMDDFLQLNPKQSYQHSDLHLQANSIEYLDKIRVDTQYSQDEQQSGEESFSVRFYPKNFDSYNLEKQNFRNKQEYLNHTMDRENLSLQEQNYKLLVDIKFQSKIIIFLKKTIALYRKQLRIKRKLMDGKFYVESIFFMNQKIQLLTLRLQKQKRIYYSRIKAVSLGLDGKYKQKDIEKSIQKYTLMNSVKIINTITNANFISLREEGIDTQLENEKANLIQEQLKLEKMKEEFSFDFIEANYKNQHNKGNSFSFGIGIDLPLKSSNQIQIMQKKMALIELNEKDKVEDGLYLRQVKLLSNEAQTLYHYEKGLKKVLKKDSFYKLYSKKEDADPRFMLEVQEQNLDGKEELLSIQKKLHQVYIKLLVLTHGFNNRNLNPNNKRKL